MDTSDLEELKREAEMEKMAPYQRHRARMTEEQKREMREKNNLRNKARYHAMTDEERREFCRRNHIRFVEEAPPEAREAKRVYSAAYMRKHRQKFVDRNRELAQQRKQMLIERFGGVCKDCHGLFPSAVFHFHHVEPTTKAKEVSNLLGGDLQVLLAEAEKCVMLCANCHIIRHATRETISAVATGRVYSHVTEVPKQEDLPDVE